MIFASPHLWTGSTCTPNVISMTPKFGNITSTPYQGNNIQNFPRFKRAWASGNVHSCAKDQQTCLSDAEKTFSGRKCFFLLFEAVWCFCSQSSHGHPYARSLQLTYMSEYTYRLGLAKIPESWLAWEAKVQRKPEFVTRLAARLNSPYIFSSSSIKQQDWWVCTKFMCGLDHCEISDVGSLLFLFMGLYWVTLPYICGGIYFTPPHTEDHSA